MTKFWGKNGVTLIKYTHKWNSRLCLGSSIFLNHWRNGKWYCVKGGKEKNEMDKKIFSLGSKLKKGIKTGYVMDTVHATATATATTTKVATKTATKTAARAAAELEMKKEMEIKNYKDLYFRNKLIEKKLANIKIDESHNKLLFEYLPIEGRTEKVPFPFKLMKYIYLSILSTGVILIHVFSEIGKEQYIRDIWTFEIYFLSCFLTFHGGFNSMLQLLQYAVPENRKYKGLYNSLRFISSLIPLFFGLVCTATCEQFPKDSLLFLIVSYISLLFNYYLLHIKCLVPFWLFRQIRFLISFTLINQFLLLLSEAQMYRGRKVSLKLLDTCV